MTKPIVQELQDFTSGATAFFYNHHTCDNSLLRRFLSSTMDEARLSFADRYAAQVLMKYDLDDWVHFRQGVHRREVGGNISYAAQRDHSAHTLNNYLLGAYFWEYAPGIRKLIAQHMARRHMLVCDGPYNSQDFFSLWVMASLLHDIGYLFEGAAMPSTTMHSSALNEIGVDVVREYFNSRFWVACRVTAPADRRDLLDFAGVTPFELRHGGFSGILESLRDVGNLIRLQEAINHQSLDTDRPNAIVSDRKVSDQETLITTTPIHDAFTAWSEHYKKFGCPSMVERIQELENYVCKCIYDGLDAQGMRMLDHGACSGLLMLRASTYFFSIWFGLKNADGQYRATNNENLKSAQSRFFAQVPPERDGRYISDWWWRCICWATAAAALHNHLQMKDSERTSRTFKADEDPLTYLGVLVDILQEWDRFRVNPNSLGQPEPVQGVDVFLGNADGTVEISYPSLVAAEVCKNLNKTLDGWKNYVKIISI